MSPRTERDAGWVMLVDDDADDRVLVERLWTRLGVATHLELVGDGLEALERLAGRPEDPPLGVLLDLRMPRTGGFQVLERLRGQPAPRPPVVVFSSSDDPQDVDRSYALGASGYVVKPVDVDELRRTVAALGHLWTTGDTAVPVPGLRAATPAARRDDTGGTPS